MTDKTIAFIYSFVIVISAFAGYAFPHFFSLLKPNISWLLITIMFLMGLTISVDDMIKAITKPWWIALGVCLQFLIMPIVGFSLAKIFDVDLPILIGLILVGTAPGGTASNVATYLCSGNVALSVAMTTCSTLISVFSMPLLIDLFLHQSIPVDTAGVFFDLIKMSLIPVVLGILLQKPLNKPIKIVQPALPFAALVAISVIVAIIVALNHSNLKTLAPILFVIVSLFIILGFTLGYALSRMLGLDKRNAKTLAIEVGMQNSGLATILAIKHFSTAAAVAPAIFSILQNVYAVTIFPMIQGFHDKKNKIRKGKKKPLNNESIEEALD